MDFVKVIHDADNIKFKQLSNVFDYGIHMSDGKYLFVENDDKYVAVELNGDEMLVDEFSSRVESMLWLLDFGMWCSLYKNVYMPEDEVKIIDDHDSEHYAGLLQALSDGVSMADGKYMYVEDMPMTDEKLFVPVSFSDGEMSSMEFSSNGEALLWLLKYDLWERICDEFNEADDEE